MATDYYEIIPQVGTPQTFAITLGGNPYQLTLLWREVSASGSNTGGSGPGSFTADSTEITADSSVTADTVPGGDSTLSFDQEGGGGQWVLDIEDQSGIPILTGIPLVTGVNLLTQYDYLNFGGGLWVQTGSDPDLPPTFANLGDDGQLYWVVETT